MPGPAVMISATKEMTCRWISQGCIISLVLQRAWPGPARLFGVVGRVVVERAELRVHAQQNSGNQSEASTAAL